MQYVAYQNLGTTPNIIADGAPNDHTRLTLSHWPGTEVPESLKADLSAEIAFKYLEQPEHQVDVEAVSNNHFDADGLCSIWTLLNPEEAFERRELLIDVAAAGDFGIYQDRDAARVSFFIDAWQRPDDSPIHLDIFKQPYMEQCLVLYEELLSRFDRVLDRIGMFEKFWAKEDAILTRSEEQIARGEIQIKEYPEVDLAVVIVPERDGAEKKKPHTKPWAEIVHQMAIHNRTQMLRVLLMQEQRYALYYRYETWVQFVSRPTRPRFDLSSFCGTLNEREQSGKWTCDGVKDIVPWLKLAGQEQSRIEPQAFIETLVSHLATQSSKVSG